MIGIITLTVQLTSSCSLFDAMPCRNVFLGTAFFFGGGGVGGVGGYFIVVAGVRKVGFHCTLNFFGARLREFF